MKLRVGFCSRWLLAAVAVLFCNFVIAQRTITGKVTDKGSGEPLIGANIVVVGTSTGTVTDFDGSYSLEIPANAAGLELEFSYTGYNTERVALGASNTVDLQLTAGSLLEEVVVTGYGSQKTREVSSAIVNVKAEDFNGGNVNTAAQLLQGKVAGLTITRPGGNPNESFNIRLRGLSSLSANTQPLIVVDGIQGGTIDNIDPNDIESMTILKDGSAAAIYGARASAGVILITTKSGAQGKSTVDYNGYVTAENVIRPIDVMSAAEWRELGTRLPAPADQKRGWRDNRTETEWIDEVTRTALTHVHNLSLAGGNKQTSYRVSANYRALQGALIGNGQNRLNTRLNLSQKALNDKLRVTLNASITSRKDDPGFTDALRYAALSNPTSPILSNAAADVKFGGYFEEDLFDYFNPVSIIEQNNNDVDITQFQGSLNLEYEVIEGLTIAGFYSQQHDNNFFGSYSNRTSKFGGGFGRTGFASRRNDQFKNRQATFTGTYRRDLGKAELTVTAGYDYQYNNFQGVGIDGGNFLTDVFQYNNFGASLDFPRGLGGRFTYQSDYEVTGLFGRVNLNVDDTYFLMASVRQDGCSRFGENNRYGVFPAASVAVDLVKAAGLSFADNLKLRAGYGVTGALPGESYISQLLLGPGANFFFNGNYVPSYGPFQNPNPDLKWEVKRDFSAGIDFAFMDYRLTGSLDFYSTNTQDLLFNVAVPVPPNLVPNSLINIGEIQNQGLELALNYNLIKKQNFSYDLGVTGTYYLNNKIISLSTDEFDFGSERFIAGVGSPGLNGTNMIRVKEGDRIGNFWGPIYESVAESTWRFRDLDNDGNTRADDFGNQTVIGNGLPDVEIGINNTFKFGNFDLNVFFRGVFGHELVNQYRLFYETNNTLSWNRVATKYYNPQNNAPAEWSSLYVEDASFLKLDNATLGYTVKLKPGSAFSRLRAYIAGQNLLVFTGYTGADPEVRFRDNEQGGAEAILSPGIDRRTTYFMTRGITFGVNLGF